MERYIGKNYELDAKSLVLFIFSLEVCVTFHVLQVRVLGVLVAYLCLCLRCIIGLVQLDIVLWGLAACCLLVFITMFCGCYHLASQNHGFGSINLGSIQAEYGRTNVVSPTSSRTPKYIALGFHDVPSKAIVSCYVVFSFVVLTPNAFILYFLLLSSCSSCLLFQ